MKMRGKPERRLFILGGAQSVLVLMELSRIKGLERIDGEKGLYQLKKGAVHDARSFEIFGSPSWVRTSDLRINSPSLYRLSYRGIKGNVWLSETRLPTGYLAQISITYTFKTTY